MSNKPTPPVLSDEETRRETQNMLLSGKWRMLQEVCPITHHPLFLNKTNGVIWSVKLQMPVTVATEGEGNFTTSAPLPQNAAPVKAPQASSKEVSQRIGEKLLLGWEMLGEVDEFGAPLMKDLQGELWSPSTGEFVSVQEKAPIVQQSKREKAMEEDDGAISQRIGQKLLQGWTMMAETCPVSNACPLFKDPSTGRLWSPALNDYLPQAPAEAAAVVTTAETMPVVQAEVEEPAPLAVAPTNGTELEQVRNILTSKMLDLAKRASATQDLDEMKRLFEIIRDIAATLREL